MSENPTPPSGDRADVRLPLEGLADDRSETPLPLEGLPPAGPEQPELPLDGPEPEALPEAPLPEPVVEAAPVVAAEPVEPEPVAAAEPIEAAPVVAHVPVEVEPEPAAIEVLPDPVVEAAPEPVVEAAPEPVERPKPVPRPAIPTPAEVAAAAATGPATAAPASAAAASDAPDAVPAAPAAPASDPSLWGRVADDGTVYVRTADGERPVGSYPEAGADEALAYFGRKYDELAGQVELLEQRVRSGGVPPKDAAVTVEHLREAVTDAHAVGDLASLLTRLDTIAAAVEERRKRAEAARAKAREAAVAAKERIVTDAEALGESSDWKRAGDRLCELLEEWKKAPRLERKADDALWKRFSHARTAFDKRRRAHFAELDEQRGEAAARKEKLIKAAEALSSSKEWGDTARAYRDLMTQWKAAGRARRDVEDSLWERFRAAQDAFFSARSEVFAARDAELVENLEKKRALVEEAEGLLPITDRRSARAALRGVHDRWEAIGHVPRSDRDAIEGRLKKVDDAVRSSEEAEWARSNPEARARAEATVNQLRTSIASLEAEAAKARAAGEDKKASDAQSAAETRRTWLVEAEKTLTEFS